MANETPLESAIEKLILELKNLKIKFLLVVEFEPDKVMKTLKESELKDRVSSFYLM